MSDIQFTSGEFQKFKAKVKVHLGKLQVDLKAGADILFDGTTMKMDGATYTYPEFRSALKEGWVYLDTTGTPSHVGEYIAKAAGVKVRGAKAGAPAASTEVQQDETYVGSAIRRPEAARAAVHTQEGIRLEGKKFNSTVVQEAEGDGRVVGQAIKKTASQSLVGASSEGDAIAKVKTKVKTTFTVDGSTSMNAGDADAQEAIKGITPRVIGGKFQVEDQQAQVIGGISAVAAKRKASVSVGGTKVQASPTRSVLAPPGRGIAAVAGDSLEDIIPALDDGGQAQIIAEQRRKEAAAEQRRLARQNAVLLSEAKARGEVPEDATSLPPAKVPPPAPRIAAKNPKSIEDAIIHGDDLELAPGLRWNKKIHWRLRVKKAVEEFGDKPDHLKIILGHEVPSVVQAIHHALAGKASAGVE